MAHILDVQFPDENPRGAPGGDYQQINSNPSMFGATTARAGDVRPGSGKSRHAGDRRCDRAAGDSKQGSAGRQEEQLCRQVKRHAFGDDVVEGHAALSAYPDYKQKSAELLKEAVDSVDGPKQKAMLGEALTNIQDQYWRVWGGHAAGQEKTYQKKVASDAIASNSARASNLLVGGDEQGAERALREQDMEVHNFFEGQGYDRDASEVEAQKRRGITLKTAIETVAAGGDVAKAQALFDKYRDRMDPTSVLQVTANLKSGVAQLQGRDIADEESGHASPNAEAVAGVPLSFVAQVKRSEGFAPSAKWDVKQFSSGYGTKANFEGETISREEADRRFSVEFSKAANIVDSVNARLDPGTKAALTSLTYNAGSDWVHSGLGEAIRAGDLDKAKQLFLQYNKAGGDTDEGLANRRYREAQWFGSAEAPPSNGPLVDKQTAYERVLARTDNNPLLQTAAMARLNQVYGIYHSEQTAQHAAFDQKLADTQAEAMATGTARAPLMEPDFVNRYGATDGQRQYGEYQKNLALGSDIAGLATMSPEEQNQVLARHTPQPGSAGFEAEQTRQQAVAKAIQHSNKERDDDPAAFALRRLPAAQAAYADFNKVVDDKNASPAGKTAAAARFASVTLSEQARVGVPPQQRAILTGSQVTSIGGAINAAATSVDPAARQNVIPLIKQQAELWGNNWPQVAQQILPNAAPIVKVIAAGGDPDAMLRVLSIPKGEKPVTILKEQNERQAAIERGPQGFFPGALGLITSLGVGMIDPVNAAAFSIPAIGEARMGKIIAAAGDSILARGAARFGQGAAQGAVGTAALQPADWWLHTRDGQDYTMAQAMESVVMGVGMGGAFHAIPGGVGDVLARRRGLPLAGSPQDLLLRGLMTGMHVRADQLAEAGVPLHEVPGVAPVAAPEPQAAEAAPQSNEDIEDLIDKVKAQLLPAEPVHPAQALADLPPAAREDAVHAAMADIIAGRPTQAAEILNIAADHDPRIAESLEAWHGSPHDVDRFDSSRIGTGEGAQTYGHGLYFAENEKVAAKYAKSTSGQDFIRKAQELYDEYDSPDNAHAAIEESKDFTPGQKQLLLALEKDDWLGFDYPHQAVSAALSDPNGKRWEMSPETLDAIKHVGNMYKVRIKAHQDHFLDWDKPLGEQPEPVRSKLRAAGFQDTQTGKDIYHSLVKYRPDQGGGTTSAGMKLSDLDATPEAASGRLSATGIHGIKYLDQGSRDIPARVEERNGRFAIVDDGGHFLGKHGVFDDEQEAKQYLATLPPRTRNFVVFDDKHIEITHKNGEPVEREELIAENKAQQAARKAPRGRAAADPATWSLFEHLASVGGLKPDPELRAIFGNDRGPFVPSFGPLIRKSGMSLDDALIAAKEGGYFIDPTDPAHAPVGLTDPLMQGREATFGIRDLLDKIDEESRGRRQYRADHLEATRHDPAQEHHVILGELEHELANSGAKLEDIDPKLLDRTVEIIKRVGESDVLAAYERAIMGDAERYDATAHERKSEAVTEHIPGWDAADTRTTSGDGAGGAAERGQAGRSDQGARGTDGPQPSRPGLGNRSSPAEVAADPRWRQLADATPDYNDPETLAESEAAARLPEPASVEPAKSLTALEKAAADAEVVWRQLEPTLTEQERALVNDVMDQLKLDAEARSRIITDGVACLAGAIG